MSHRTQEILDGFNARTNLYEASIAYRKSGKDWVSRAINNCRLFGFPYIQEQLSRFLRVRPLIGARHALFFGKSVILPVGDPGTGVLAVYGISPHKSERKLALWLIKNLRRGDIFYDIGAHFGYYTALAEQIVDQGEIHVFEANGKLCRYLRRNFSGMKHVYIHCGAVASASGMVDFYDASGISDSSMNSRFPTDGAAIAPVRVTALTLDQYVLAGHKPPTVIKIDIEGGEADAILGAITILKTNSPKIIMEVWGGEKGAQFSAPAVRELQKLGYDAFMLTKDGSAEGAAISDPVHHISARGVDARDNVLFLKR